MGVEVNVSPITPILTLGSEGNKFRPINRPYILFSVSELAPEAAPITISLIRELTSNRATIPLSAQ